MTATAVHIVLTTSQQMALTDVLLSYMQIKDEPQEFLDVARDITTTTGDLLRLVTSAARRGRDDSEIG